MQNIRYELVVAVCVPVLAVSAGSALAEDKKLNGDAFPHGQFTSSIKQTQLEVGLDLKWNNVREDDSGPPPPTGKGEYHEEQLRLYGRMPVDGEDATAVKIDRFSQTFHVGIRGARSWDSLCGAREQRLSVATEYGFGRYEYSPNGDAAAKQDPIEHSFDLVAEYRDARFRHGCGTRNRENDVAPQIRLKYARDWKTSDKVGVVIPGMPPGPETTKDLVISPPTVSPALELRVAVPFTFGSEFGYAPSVAYTARGNDGAWAPGGKVQRLHFEAFFYWFPAGTTGGGRIGISPFVDIRTHGMDDLHQVEYGGLIDLRFATNLLEY